MEEQAIHEFLRRGSICSDGCLACRHLQKDVFISSSCALKNSGLTDEDSSVT